MRLVSIIPRIVGMELKVRTIESWDTGNHHVANPRAITRCHIPNVNLRWLPAISLIIGERYSGVHMSEQIQIAVTAVIQRVNLDDEVGTLAVRLYQIEIDHVGRRPRDRFRHYWGIRAL